MNFRNLPNHIQCDREFCSYITIASAKVSHNIIVLLALSRKATFMHQMLGQFGTILLGVRLFANERVVLCQRNLV